MNRSRYLAEESLIPKLCDSIMDRASSHLKPPIDMIQRDKKFLISVELPGLRQEDISLEVSGRSLIVKGIYRDMGPRNTDNVIIHERKRHNVCRYIYMPILADINKLEKARFKDGVLHIQIPQVPETTMGLWPSRKILIKGD